MGIGGRCDEGEEEMRTQGRGKGKQVVVMKVGWMKEWTKDGG